jgi:hypothetical protein
MAASGCRSTFTNDLNCEEALTVGLALLSKWLSDLSSFVNSPCFASDLPGQSHYQTMLRCSPKLKKKSSTGRLQALKFTMFISERDIVTALFVILDFTDYICQTRLFGRYMARAPVLLDTRLGGVFSAQLRRLRLSAPAFGIKRSSVCVSRK